MEASYGYLAQSVGDVPHDASSWIDAQKKRFRPWEILRADVVLARRKFAALITRLPQKRLVFLDETGINRSMARSHGWSPKGEPLVDYRPTNRGDNFTVIGAVSCDRIICNQTIKGALNIARWTDFVRKRLAPRLSEGDILIMDNLRIHHHADALDILENKGVEVLFLPPYSPDFNPIEPVWAYMKWRLKTFAERDPASLPRTVWKALLSVTPKLLAAWFEHCRNAQVN